MFVLNTIAHETIWGGQRLLAYSEEPCARVGHLYSVYGTEESSCKILSGENKGATLYQYFLRIKDRYGWNEYSAFPISVALVDAAADLSIQVHPSDSCAAKLEGAAKGKNESFYFLAAPPDHKMVCACACGSINEFQEMIREKRYLETTKSVRVSEEDYVFVPAGTLHSLQAGSLVYEIEEICDFTYRFYDYDRIDAAGNKRPLHTGKALSAIEVGNAGEVKRYQPGCEIVERYYATKLLENQAYYHNESNCIECLTVLSGALEIDGVQAGIGRTVILEPGDCVQQQIKKAIVARIR